MKLSVFVREDEKMRGTVNAAGQGSAVGIHVVDVGRCREFD